MVIKIGCLIISDQGLTNYIYCTAFSQYNMKACNVTQGQLFMNTDCK